MLIKKILLIEDNEDTIKIIKNTLNKNGWEVTIAKTGEEGLKIEKKDDTDIILLDLLLPEMNGFEVLKKLKKLNNAKPIVILSNLGSDEDMDRGKKLGAEYYLVKGRTSMEDLVKIIKKIESSPL